MELKDVCSLSYSFEDLQPFCIKSNKHGTFSIMSKWCVQILKPQFSFSMDMNRFNFQTDRIQCPQSCTTALLDTQDLEIYDSATMAEKQDILIDKRYLPKLSDPLIQSCATAWSPPNPRGYCYLGYLSNYGGLEIFTDSVYFTGTWHSCLNVGNHWFGHLVKDIEFPIRDFKTLDKLVQDILISTMCWDEGCLGSPVQRLLCATKSNKLVLFTLSFDTENLDAGLESIDIQNIVEIDQKHVTALKWIQTEEGNAYIVSGSLDGKICLYSVTTTGSIELKTTLWEETDQLAVGTIEFSVIEDGKLLVTAVKGSHLLFFLLKQDGTLFKDTIELIPGYSINGLILLQPHSFMVATLDGSCYVTDIKLAGKKILVQTKNVSFTFNLSSYSLFGLAASPNKAYYILASFATQPYDHLVLRQPANMVICRSTSVQHVKTLMANPDSNIYFMMDYAEVVRYMGGKDMPSLRELESQINLEMNAGVSEEYLSELRAAVIIQAARFSYFRLRSKEETELTRVHSNILYEIIESIRAFLVLQQLFDKIPNVNKWTEGQRQAGYALVTFLKTFLKSKIDNEGLKIVQEKLGSIFSSITESSKASCIRSTPEVCSFCDEELSIGALNCRHGHKTPRCSISKLQLETVNPVTCSYCKHSVTDNFHLLQEITLKNEKLLTCVLCNVPLGNEG